MNAELEALLLAWQAVLDAASPKEEKALSAILESRLEDAAERLGISKENLRTVVRRRHFAWIRAQRNPTTIPPKA
jgi:hypothetical protein